MTISMYSATAPLFDRQLGAMLGWLDKAQAHAEARKFDPNNYLPLRLAPDMFPLVRQVQICCDTVKGCMARLSGVDAPKWEDSEATLDDLRERIRKTRAYVASFTAAQIDGSEERDIVIPLPRRDPLQFKGEAYLTRWALPNFFFHATTVYALLRSAGVEVGKTDFLA